MPFSWSAFRRHPIVKALASLKLAVFVILAFIIAMIAGTVMESLYGREFAKRAVYDAIPFWMILILLFINILFAALVRLPFQKRLAGFYLIHLGLLTVLTGGWMTYHFGLDGVMELLPQDSNARVLIDEPQLYMSIASDRYSYQRVMPLPKVIREYRRESPLAVIGPYDVYLDRYLPYAIPRIDWVPDSNVPARMVLWMTIGNDRFKEDVQLGTVNGYEQEATVGKLTVRLLPEVSADQVDLDAWRATPHVLVLNDRTLLYGKGNDWQQAPIELFAEHKLPWMDLTLQVTRMIRGREPHYRWIPNDPIGPDDAKEQAALVRVVNRSRADFSQEKWVGQTRETEFDLGDTRFTFFIGQKVHKLGFALSLERFNMGTNPGTDEPASYESFVKVIDPSGSSKDAHVYMNHPLKEDRYTFYQSSYFPLADGSGYGSVFSVNYDPGRPIKYAGSALVVFGAILHYYLRRQKQ